MNISKYIKKKSVLYVALSAITLLNISTMKPEEVKAAENIVAANNISTKFSDVSSNHYAYQPILWAQEKGIISGYADGTFGPGKQVTEGQFAAMIANYFNLQTTSGKLTKYTPNEVWTDLSYNQLAAYGVPLNGYFDNKIRNRPVTRGVVAQALVHLVENNYNLTESIQFFLDNNISSGQNQEYKNIDVEKYFGSYSYLTRAHVVTFLYKLNELNMNEVGENTNHIYSTMKVCH